jgi:hypothetical protein
MRSAVKRVEFISDMMSYITLKGCWCDIVLNVNEPTEDKIDDTKDSFMRNWSVYWIKSINHMKILLSKLSREV